MPEKDDCLPCQGYCKTGAICFNRKMAERILAAIYEDRGQEWSDDQILWALQVTGDLPVAD